MTSKWEHQAISWYDAHAQNFTQSIQHADPSKDLQKFLSCVQKDRPVLDVGCGTGRDLKFISESGYQAYGLEPSLSLALQSQKSTPHRIITTPLSKGIGTSLWGGIWCMGVFVHIPLKEWENHLRILVDGLMPLGVLHCHTKIGEGEGIDSRGRPLCMMSPKDFMACTQNLDCQDVSVVSRSVVDYQNKSIDWMCLSLTKRP